MILLRTLLLPLAAGVGPEQPLRQQQPHVGAALAPLSGERTVTANGARTGTEPPSASVHAGALTTTLPVTQITFSHECEMGGSGCLGSPNIIRASPTTLLASHDHYKLSPDGKPGTVYVWSHTANGDPHEPWSNVANVTGIYWAEFLAVPAEVADNGGSDGGSGSSSSSFTPTHIYLIGTSTDLAGVANVVISKCLSSPCDGRHWSKPAVILRALGGKGLGFHSSGAGIVWANGRVYRALEALSGVSGCVMKGGLIRDSSGSKSGRKIDLAPMMLSAPASCGANLTEASCWSASKPLCFDDAWRLPGGVTPTGD
jgi:hypothetical protein